MDAPVTPDDIDWSPSPRLVIDDKRCPVCNRIGGHSVILTVPAMEPRGRTLTLIRCSGCGSAFYEPPDIADFSDLGHEREQFWRFYVEVGGGVWETIWPILAAADKGSFSTWAAVSALHWISGNEQDAARPLDSNSPITAGREPGNWA